MKKWLIPLTYPLISAAVFLLCGAAGAWGNGDGTGYGGAVIVLCGLIFYCVIGIPVMCIVYAKRCLSAQRFRFLFTLYQSVLFVLPYQILFFKENETVIYSFILFAWCEIWSLMGLIRWKREKADINQTSKRSQS